MIHPSRAHRGTVPAVRRLLILLILAGAPLGPLVAQESVPERNASVLSSSDGYFALAAALGTLALAPLDAHIASALSESTVQQSPAFRIAARGAEMAGGVGSLAVAGGLYAGGNLLSSSTLTTTGVRTAEAILLAELLVYSLKGITGRARPRLDHTDPLDFRLGRGISSGSYRSFPSGHTAAAFAVASVLTHAVGEHHPDSRILAGSLLYTGATLTGVSRLYHNEHWLSDTAMGGAIGLFSGWKVIRYHRSREQPTGLDRWLLSVSIIGGQPAAISILPLPGQ